MIIIFPSKDDANKILQELQSTIIFWDLTIYPVEYAEYENGAVCISHPFSEEQLNAFKERNLDIVG